MTSQYNLHSNERQMLYIRCAIMSAHYNDKSPPPRAVGRRVGRLQPARAHRLELRRRRVDVCTRGAGGRAGRGARARGLPAAQDGAAGADGRPRVVAVVAHCGGRRRWTQKRQHLVFGAAPSTSPRTTRCAPTSFQTNFSRKSRVGGGVGWHTASDVVSLLRVRNRRRKKNNKPPRAH